MKSPAGKHFILGFYDIGVCTGLSKVFLGVAKEVDAFRRLKIQRKRGYNEASSKSPAHDEGPDLAKALGEKRNRGYGTISCSDIFLEVERSADNARLGN